MFEDRHLRDIGDQEIIDLIEQRVPESQDLEYKAKYDLRDDQAKLEALKDIAAFANASGGYLIIGIREAGRGIPSRLEPLRDPQRIAQQLRDLASRYIAERIEGLEIEARETEELRAVLIRIPTSARRPHLVGYLDQTAFQIRYGDTKRAMSIGEVRDLIAQDAYGNRLSNIESSIRDLSDRAVTDEALSGLRKEVDRSPTALLRAPSSTIAEVLMSERFAAQVGDEPYFRTRITPVSLNPELVNINDPQIIGLLRSPPSSRSGGWNMAMPTASFSRLPTGVAMGRKDHEYFELHSNGHMEFWAPLNQHFCWRQSDEEFRTEPRLYPYAVVEYPVTFARLGWQILSDSGYQGDVTISLEYWNVQGYVLRPGEPQALVFDFEKSEPYPNEHLVLPESHSIQKTADLAVLPILKAVYQSFGLDSRWIPFYSEEDGRFNFGSGISTF